MPPATVTLDPDQAAFAAARIADGSYETLDDLMREAFRLLAEREEVLEELREELRKGEESGEAVPFEPDKWRKEWNAEWEAEHGRDEGHPTARRA